MKTSFVALSWKGIGAALLLSVCATTNGCASATNCASNSCPKCNGSATSATDPGHSYAPTRSSLVGPDYYQSSDNPYHAN